jgi:hypothetical protein
MTIGTPAPAQDASIGGSDYSDSAAAGQVPSREDALTNKIEQDDPRLDSEIRDICPSCGGAEDAPVHQGPSAIDNGFNREPAKEHRFISGCGQSTTVSITSPPRMN